MSNNDLLLQKVQGCLYGGAIGDAMGAPAEWRMPDEIQARYGYITDLVEAWSEEDTRGRGHGRYTDDTHMIQLLCECYIEHGDHLDAHEFFRRIAPKMALEDRWIPERGRHMPLVERLFYPEKWLYMRWLGNADPRNAGVGNMVNCGAAMYAAPVGIAGAATGKCAGAECCVCDIAHETSLAPTRLVRYWVVVVKRNKEKVLKQSERQTATVRSSLVDLDTFITILYCFIADLCKENDHRIPKQTTGPRSKISIAEVLSLCILSQMRGNVPRRSERSFVMHMLAHRKGMFRSMPKHSHLNKRRRKLSDLLVPLQQDLAQALSPPIVLTKWQIALPFGIAARRMRCATSATGSMPKRAAAATMAVGASAANCCFA